MQIFSKGEEEDGTQEHLEPLPTIDYNEEDVRSPTNFEEGAKKVYLKTQNKM